MEVYKGFEARTRPSSCDGPKMYPKGGLAISKTLEDPCSDIIDNGHIMWHY
jgi:hypothetical protein